MEVDDTIEMRSSDSLATSESEKCRHKRGRPKRALEEHPVHKLFKLVKTDEGIESSCNVKDCGMKLPGNHAGNKMSHLKTHHKDIYQNVQVEWDRKTQGPSAAKQSKKEPRVLNGVRMSGQALQLHCLRLITEEGLSFKTLDYPSFQSIIRPMIQQMPAKERVVISSRTMPPKISSFADRVRAEISSEVEGKMVSIMVDGCTKGRRHFIGVNVQFVKDSKIVVRTLAVEELHLSQTGANLKQVITRILRKYGISVKSVVSFTSDNGPNYILAGKLLSEEEAEEELEEYEQMPWSELEVELVHCDVCVQGVRCAAHTMQLAVDDALKSDGSYAEIITATRDLAKFLRTPSNADQLKTAGLPIPVLDVVTRWGSTFDMLVSVAKLRNFMELSMIVSAKERGQHYLTDEQWDLVDAMIKDLDPVRRATTKLQAESLSLGQFLAIWYEATMKLKKREQDSSLAKKLLAFMEERSQPQSYKDKKRRKSRAGKEKLPSLFRYPSFNAAVYLDPRYFSLLEADQIADARTFLLGLWSRLQAVRGVAPLPVEHDGNSTDTSIYSEDSDDEEGSFAKFLAQKNRERQVCKANSARRQGATATMRISQQLQDYDETTSPLPESANVLEFWESQRLVCPELYELAKIVLAIPATQVSVERLFSALRYILRPQRFSMSEANIDDSVFLHANRDLVEILAEDLLCEKNFIASSSAVVAEVASSASNSTSSPPSLSSDLTTSPLFNH